MNRKARDREAGQAAVLFGLMLTALIGLVALAVDGGNLYLIRRQMQAASDLAALSGAQDLYTGTPAAAASDAQAYAALNGYPGAIVNVPPSAGPHLGDDEYLEVVITQTTPTFFAGIFGVSTVDVVARAVARSGLHSPPYALIALNTTACPGISFSGSSAVQVRNAGMMSNSSCNPSIVQTSESGSVMSDGPVNAVGTISGDFTAPQVKGGAPLYPDPLATARAPTFGDDGTDVPLTRSASRERPNTLVIPSSGGPLPPDVYNGYDDHTFGPGVYWGGIRIAGGTYRMAPGVYVIAGGGFEMSGGSLTGNGIFIYNTNDPRPRGGTYGGATGDYGPINLNTNQGIELKASHVPLYPGMPANVLIFQDRQSIDNADGMTLQASGNTSLYGTIYVPGTTVSIAGGGAADVAHGQIIADTIRFTGSSATGATYESEWAVVTAGATLVE